MNFAFNEEQEEFRQTLRRFFEEKSPTPEVFRLMQTAEGYDPAVWKQMGEELGLQGVHLAEAHGGQGFGFLELGLVCEEMGRALVCAPYFSTACLAAGAIRNGGTGPQQERWLPELASGQTIGTLALLDAKDVWSAEGVGLELRRNGDAYVLDGNKRLVTDGATAGLVVVAARQPGSRSREGVTLLVVRGDAPGLTAKASEPLDLTRKLADLELDGVRAELLGQEGGGADALDRTLDQARVCLALEAAGGAERCLESAVEYAKRRIQFARPIGSFQAIKHKCAALLLEVESAKSAAYWASWVASEDRDELTLAASVAKSFCDEAYVHAAEDNMQIHGGIGVTWEADPHLYFKRAKSNATLLGHPSWQRERIADHLGF
jgi:alkylation response protein AidB-like acyl-CoA dehydrogenase